MRYVPEEPEPQYPISKKLSSEQKKERDRRVARRLGDWFGTAMLILFVAAIWLPPHLKLALTGVLSLICGLIFSFAGREEDD